MDKVLKRLDEMEKTIIATKKNVLNVDEVCILTGLSKSSIYKFTMDKTIAHYKKAKHLFFDRLEVEAWMKSNRVDSVEEIKDKAAESLNIKQKGR